jgi:diadenosine tetraphosphate (Ap4A) HIT family hydrolase
VSPGHTLVVTRRLVGTWFEATSAEQAAAMALIREVKRQLDERHHPDGCNVGFNAGDAPGHTVPDLHVHPTPRYRGDRPDPAAACAGCCPVSSTSAWRPASHPPPWGISRRYTGSGAAC